MACTVSEEILKQTNCQKAFRCLSGNMEGFCDILIIDDPPNAAISCPKKNYKCDYHKPFDDEVGFCDCPTRIELFKRYGI